MKLSKDMVEAMGGANSDQMKKFRSHCYNAFLILRKNANLILNLFALMVDSNVADIALDPDKTVGFWCRMGCMLCHLIPSHLCQCCFLGTKGAGKVPSRVK